MQADKEYNEILNIVIRMLGFNPDDMTEKQIEVVHQKTNEIVSIRRKFDENNKGNTLLNFSFGDGSESFISGKLDSSFEDYISEFELERGMTILQGTHVYDFIAWMCTKYDFEVLNGVRTIDVANLLTVNNYQYNSLLGITSYLMNKCVELGIIINETMPATDIYRKIKEVLPNFRIPNHFGAAGVSFENYLISMIQQEDEGDDDEADYTELFNL